MASLQGKQNHSIVAPRNILMAKTSNAGLVVAALALTAVSVNAWKHDKHEDEIHEHQRAEQNWQLYYSAPSRQALRVLLAKTHYSSADTNELLTINRDINICGKNYQERTRTFIAICVQDPRCDQSLRVHNPNGSVTLSTTYGLDGLEPNSFISNYVPLRIRDIVDSADLSELSEQNTRNILHLVASRVASSINISRTTLETCQSKLALVDSSIAIQSHK